MECQRSAGRHEKGFLDTFNALDADLFCLQETKLQEGQIDIDLPGYEQYWNYADRKGYSGTAIFTRIKPLSVRYGMDKDEHNHEGRLITLEFDDYFFVTCYTPNSQSELARLPYRMQWEDDFKDYLLTLHQENRSSSAATSTSPTRKSTSRTPRPTARTPASPMKNGRR